MAQSVRTKDFLCFAKCTECTDKDCTPAIANPVSGLGACLTVGVITECNPH